MSAKRLGAVAGGILALSLGVAQGAAPVDLFAELKISRVNSNVPLMSFDLKTLDGRTVRSQDFAGKVVLLNFWATWCGPCKEEMPSLARLQQRLDPERFAVLTVTADMHPQGIKQFLGQLGLELPVLFDEQQDMSRLFMVRGLPTTVFLAQDGRVIGRAVGPRAWDSEEFVALMRQMLEGGR